MELYKISDEFIPVQAIISYMSENTHYLESHDIKQDGSGVYSLLEGKPLKLKTIQTLVNALAVQSTTAIRSKGIFPENLMYFNQYAGSTVLMWFVPEQKQNFYFIKSLGIPSGQAYTPPLVFALNNSDLSIYAVKENVKPNNQTKLYHAPFHNIYDDGKVCLGNAKKPSSKISYIDEIIEAWDKVFWSSEFSQILGRNPTFSNLNSLYKRLIVSGERFPENELREHEELRTIEELFKTIK